MRLTGAFMTLCALVACGEGRQGSLATPVLSYNESNPLLRIDSWTTVDINVGYRVDGGSGWLANTQFNLGINNALDQRPPFVNQFDLTSGTLGYDPANASQLGRQVSLQVVKLWGQ